MGNAIVLSTWNKPFKLLGFPSKRVKSCESLAETLPTNIFHIHVNLRIKYLQNNGFLFMNNLKLTHHYTV
jgi:hypothetical protein